MDKKHQKELHEELDSSLDTLDSFIREARKPKYF